MADTHIYAATKHAVRAITEGVRQELREMKSSVKVTVRIYIIIILLSYELNCRKYQQDGFVLRYLQGHTTWRTSKNPRSCLVNLLQMEK